MENGVSRMDNCPSWLKSMQNGSIGEMRTKAFLIDRFWILERSVDIHGADFIIQRRLYGENILDTEPPRFGKIQAKFSQDENTYHYINKRYILDSENKPRKELFVIINTGNEKGHRMFLLSADDILSDFYLDKDNYKFIIPSKKVFSSAYEVLDNKKSLDRIENSIKCAEFYKNRNFLFTNLSSVERSFDNILPEYKIDIENRFDDIPRFFKEQKQRAFNTILELEKAHESLKEFVESPDPIDASSVAEEIDSIFGQEISLPDIFNADFYYTSKYHKGIIDDMRSDSILENYISMRKSIVEEIESFFISYPSNDVSKSDVHKIHIVYNPVKLTFESIINSIKRISEGEIYSGFNKFIRADQGTIIYSWKVGIIYDNYGCLKMNDCCLIDIMEKIYELKYYEGCEINEDK